MSLEDPLPRTALATILHIFEVRYLKNDRGVRETLKSPIDDQTDVPSLPIEVLIEILKRSLLKDVLLACLSSKRLLHYLTQNPLKTVVCEVNFPLCRIEVTEPTLEYVWQIKNHGEHDVEDTLACLNFLKSIFKVKVESVVVGRNGIQALASQPWLDQVKKMKYEFEHPKPPQSDDYKPDNETLRALLDSMSNLEDLTLEDGIADWRCDKMYNVDHLTFTDGHYWIQDWDLEYFNNKTVSIDTHNFPPEDIIWFLSEWKEGKVPNLEMFTINNNMGTNYKILEELDAKPFDCKRRHSHFILPDDWSGILSCPSDKYNQFFHYDRSFGVNLTEAWDVERTIDGQTTLGSVLLTEYRLIFLVWPHPFPILYHIPVLEKQIADAKEEVQNLKSRVDLRSKLKQIRESEQVLEKVKSLLPQYEGTLRRPLKRRHE